MALRFSFEQSFIGQALNKFRRRSRGSKKKGKKANDHIQLIFSLSFIKKLIGNIPSLVKIVLLISVVLTIILYPVSTYFSIQPKPFESNDLATKPTIFNSNYFHTVIYGISENDNYKYVDYIVIAAHGDQTKLIQVTPLFSSQKYGNVSLRSFLNEVESDEGGTKMHKLNDAISTMLGVRIDRYIMVRTEYINSYFQDKKINLDDNIFNTDLINNSEYINNQTQATYDFFQNSFDLLNKFRLFWSLPKVTENIYTDMSRSELVRFFGRFSSGKSIQIVSLGLDYGNIYESPDKVLSIEPNYIIIDEKLLGFLSNIEILAEQCEIEIYNASTVRGLASALSRELQNQGINIVKFGNYFESEKETTLFLRDESDFTKYTNTILAVQQSLRGDVKIEVGKYPYNQTGDLILVLAD